MVAGAVLVRRTRRGLALLERRAEDLGRERDSLRDTLRKHEVELVRRRELIERLQRSRRAERSWNAELRAQLQREHQSRGGLEEGADAREFDPAGGDQAGRGREGIAAVALRRGRRRPPRPRVRAWVRAQSGAQHDCAALCAGSARSRPDHPRGHAPKPHPMRAGAEIENLVAIPLYLHGRFDGVIVCANRRDGFEEHRRRPTAGARRPCRRRTAE